MNENKPLMHSSSVVEEANYLSVILFRALRRVIILQTLLILVELLRRVFYLTLFISAKINMIKKLAIMPNFCRRYNRIFVIQP